MTEIVEVGPEEQAGEASPDLTPSQALASLGEDSSLAAQIGEKPARFDMRTWIRISCILAIQAYLLKEGTVNVADACRETGWQRWTYEHAIREPAVIEYMSRRMHSVYDHGARLIEDMWPDVVRSQIAIARDTTNGQAATRAATWLSEQLERQDERAQVILREAEQLEGPSRLQHIARRFGAELTEKTTVTRSVKLPAPD